MKTVKVIRHLAFEDLGSLQPALEACHAEIEYIEAGQDSFPANLADCDLLVILGGPIGAYDETDFPFLSNELAIIEHRLAHNKPILGICLGAQLIARAAGADVYPGGTKEIGWGELTVSEADNNPLSPLNGVSILHWHGDTFNLPKDAQRLASNHNYPNQAFAIGSQVLALQFHPEVTEPGLERWLIGHISEISATEGVSVTQLRKANQQHAPSLEPVAQQVWRNWLAQLQW